MWNSNAAPPRPCSATLVASATLTTPLPTPLIGYRHHQLAARWGDQEQEGDEREGRDGGGVEPSDKKYILSIRWMKYYGPIFAVILTAQQTNPSRQNTYFIYWTNDWDLLFEFNQSIIMSYIKKIY